MVLLPLKSIQYAVFAKARAFAITTEQTPANNAMAVRPILNFFITMELLIKQQNDLIKKMPTFFYRCSATCLSLRNILSVNKMAVAMRTVRTILNTKCSFQLILAIIPPQEQGR